jgi:tetratricopeptide (TPR) repeat protein
MKLGVWLICLAPLVLLCVSLNGCVPSGQSGLDEEKERHYQEGKSCSSSMDFKGAIVKFEQTLEANPRHAKAHLELGCLFEEREPDPAAAIYHYEQYLKLRPHAENAEFVRQRIMNCKLDLAKTVLLPITPAPALQRQFEQLAAENKRLRDELEQCKAYYAAHPPSSAATADVLATAPPTAGAIRVAPAPQPDAQPASLASSVRPATSTARTYVVQSGDSAYSIARRYGVKLEALMAANPGLEPRRMRVGQPLSIPAP